MYLGAGDEKEGIRVIMLQVVKEGGRNDGS